MSANYFESRTDMHIFSSWAFESPREGFWNVAFVYEVNLNADGSSMILLAKTYSQPRTILS